MIDLNYQFLKFKNKFLISFLQREYFGLNYIVFNVLLNVNMNLKMVHQCLCREVSTGHRQKIDETRSCGRFYTYSSFCWPIKKMSFLAWTHRSTLEETQAFISSDVSLSSIFIILPPTVLCCFLFWKCLNFNIWKFNYCIKHCSARTKVGYLLKPLWSISGFQKISGLIL